MIDKTDILWQRVQSIMPALTIEQFEVNQEGLINDVVIVNNSLVFRFPKNERSTEILEGEMKILDLVRPNIQLDVPTPVYRSQECVVYPFLTGKPLLREMILEVDGETQAHLAGQLGGFLYGLHTTATSRIDWDIPATLAPVTLDRWLEIRQRVEEKVFPLLLKHQVQWAENLFDQFLNDPDSFESTLALIHADLAPYHILYDDQKGEITGILDFGVAGMGDPALDIGNLMTSYGESFVSRMENAYPELGAYLPRARFYSQAIELQWVLLGLETGEKFWFTAHIGGARDIRV